MAKCTACNGTGKAGMYVHHKCYRCSGTGKANKKRKGRKK